MRGSIIDIRSARDIKLYRLFVFLDNGRIIVVFTSASEMGAVLKRSTLSKQELHESSTPLGRVVKL